MRATICLVAVLVPTLSAAQRSIVREVDVVEAQRARFTAAARAPRDEAPLGVGQVSGSALSGNVPQTRMEAFLRLDEAVARVGTPVLAVVEIINRSNGPLEVPSALQPASVTSRTNRDAVLSVSAELLCDGRRHSILPGPTLHAGRDDPASWTILQPGEGIRVRLEFGWLGSAYAHSQAATRRCTIRPLVGFLRPVSGSNIVVLPGEGGLPLSLEGANR